MHYVMMGLDPQIYFIEDTSYKGRKRQCLSHCSYQIHPNKHVHCQIFIQFSL